MTRTTAIALAVILLVGAGAIALPVVREATAHRGRILPGVSINAIPVGAMSPDEARAHVEASTRARLSETLEVRAGDPVARPTLAELGVRAEVNEAIAAAYGLGREAGLLRRIQTRWRLRRGIDLPLRFSQDDERIRAFASSLAPTVDREPQDARVTVQEDRVIVTAPAVEGRRLDVEATAARIRQALASSARSTEAAYATAPPRFTTEMAQSLTTPLAAFSTRFANIPNRNHNIALAAGKLRGVVLLPGEAFSFNDAVGPRTAKQGYRPAPVLINNVLVPGDGGGVCQVSSTLFNVALLADLEIVARSNHSRPVAYLPVGRDATVVYGAIDLRFRNTTGGPVLLWSTVSGLRLTFALFGPADAQRQVSIVVTDRKRIAPPAHTITRKDPDLPAGVTAVDAPKPGYRVQTYRIVERDGLEVKRELVVRSYYRPLPRTIRVGTKGASGPSARRP